MNNKEFEDFFKDLDPTEVPAPREDEDDFVFSSFFEDETSKKVQEEPMREIPAPSEDFEEDNIFAPPPKEDEEPVYKEKTEQKQSASKKADDEAKKRKKRIYNTAYNWLLTVIWVSAVLAVSVFIATFALSSINDLVGFSKESKEIQITIPEGANLSDIADILESNGVIDEPFTFEVYARIKEKEGKLAPGTYTLNSNLGYDQIFQVLRSKENEREVVSLTFPEGMTVSEIAKLLDENNVCKYDEFIAAVNTETFEYEFETMMGTNEYIYHKWEGYLFPDTYEFFTNSTPRSVMAKFISNFNNKISGYYVRMQELGMSLDEVITLASMIQSEAAYMDDMEKVSSAFHNRLAPNSGFTLLQSDVTWFYYDEEIKPYITDEALSDAYHESYDTYYKNGLPVGPICNPGINAIEAALYPANTNYYYFVTDTDGVFYYAATLAEHEQNIIAAGRG